MSDEPTDDPDDDWLPGYDVPLELGVAVARGMTIYWTRLGKDHENHADHVQAALESVTVDLRSRLEKVEALLARALGDGGIRTSVAAADDGEVRQALTEVRSMLKETT